MKSPFSYLIVIFGIMYWIFRIMVCLMYSMGKEFICQPSYYNIEMVIIFLTVPSIVFVIRRNTTIASLYFLMYGSYFGLIVYKSLVGADIAQLNIAETTSIFATALGIIIPFLIFIDILLEKSRFHPKDRKTDWYFNDEKYDRNFDERADRNQYKIK